MGKYDYILETINEKNLIIGTLATLATLVVLMGFRDVNIYMRLGVAAFMFPVLLAAGNIIEWPKVPKFALTSFIIMNVYRLGIIYIGAIGGIAAVLALVFGVRIYRNRKLLLLHWFQVKDRIIKAWRGE